MPEVAVDLYSALHQRADPSRPLLELGIVVGRLAQAEIAKRRSCIERTDANGVRREIGLDPVPRLVAEVEGEPHRRIERAENEREQSLVTGGADVDADRAEPIAEEPHSLGEGRHVE